MGEIADQIIGDILEFGDEYLESFGLEDGTHTPGYRTYSCKYCKKEGLRWQQFTRRDWRLCEPGGEVHECKEYFDGMEPSSE